MKLEIMKKILLILIAFIFASSPVFAIEDDYSDSPFWEDKEEELVLCEKSLKEKLNDVYHLEVEQIDKPHFLLTEILTKKHSEDSIWETTQLWTGYNADWTEYISENGSTDNHYNIYAINVGLDGKLKNNNADYRIMLHYTPDSNRDFVQNLFADVYVATNKIPHHRVWLGNSRPRVGYEGGYSPYTLPFMLRSQISRNFGSVRRLGARITGDYSLVDYDLGIYNSSTYFQSFFPGTDFIGWINFKPLGLTDGKYGKINIGGGLHAGEQDVNYQVAGAYLGYEYKKMLLNFEWANADGYNGPAGYAINKKATGFYSTLAYRFTPKVQGLIRYDEFDPNKNVSNNKNREYSLGLNYFIKGQALKLVFNYVFCQNDSVKNSHRLMFGTQVLL
ncbi:MAG: hypothetical protein E7Z92_07825 [Cyanobacteria bacterium SIG31]|nr:hypothetical protein [Cyanobacteria bacterium SIG31]